MARYKGDWVEMAKYDTPSSTTSPKPIDTKKQLIDFCIQKQNVTIEAAREAMIRVQDSANEETAGGEDKFESFREQCQIDRDMYAKKINESMQGLAILKGLTTKLLFEASLGAVIITETNVFLCL